MSITEINSKSLLRKFKKADSWFVARYGMNVYRGCKHNCAYCDGRSEGYYTNGVFGKDIEVKINSIQLLEKELNPKRKRKPIKKGFIVTGGGVSDLYQPVEKKYKFAKKILQTIYKYNYPIHILTKSTLVERDLNIIKAINKKNKAIVSMSFSSANDKISKIMEPNVPTPSARFETLAKFKAAGITIGMFLMPLIPLLTDTEEQIEKIIIKAKETGVDFVIFGGMTLKKGKQKDHYFNVLKQYYPKEITRYNKIYFDRKYGEATWQYYNYIEKNFVKIANKYKINKRIYRTNFEKHIDKKDLIIIILEQIDYLLKQKGTESNFGKEAYHISQSKQSITELIEENKLNNKAVEIIKEINNTGTSKLYDSLFW